MSFELLERGVAALGPLTDAVVFVGGATLVLWITDPAAPSPRPTLDVDVIVELTSRRELRAFDASLRGRGFREDVHGGVIGRWRHGEELVLDAIPADASLLGFENRWQRAALPHALRIELPSGASLRAVSPPYLLATKLEAFAGRGGGDLLGSRDLADVLSLIDGREELVAEFAAASAAVRRFVTADLDALLKLPRFTEAVFGSLPPDAASQDRAEAIVLPRLRALIAAG